MKAYVERFRGLSITTKDWETHFWQYWEGNPELREQAAKLRHVDFDVGASCRVFFS